MAASTNSRRNEVRKRNSNVVHRRLKNTEENNPKYTPERLLTKLLMQHDLHIIKYFV